MLGRLLRCQRSGVVGHGRPATHDRHVAEVRVRLSWLPTVALDRWVERIYSERDIGRGIATSAAGAIGLITLPLLGGLGGGWVRYDHRFPNG